MKPIITGVMSLGIAASLLLPVTTAAEAASPANHRQGHRGPVSVPSPRWTFIPVDETSAPLLSSLRGLPVGAVPVAKAKPAKPGKPGHSFKDPKNPPVPYGYSTNEKEQAEAGARAGAMRGLVDGAIAGAVTGGIIGAIPGATIGAVVGVPIGISLGSTVGGALGGSIGCAIGGALIPLVGCLVGTPIGTVAGIAIGAVGGAVAGLVVGAVIGGTAGFLVGALIGAPIGALFGAAGGAARGYADGVDRARRYKNDLDYRHQRLHMRMRHEKKAPTRATTMQAGVGLPGAPAVTLQLPKPVAKQVTDARLASANRGVQRAIADMQRNPQRAMDELNKSALDLGRALGVVR